jgi:TIR domain
MGVAASPMVFISHSSKPLEHPGDERLQYARSVLGLIEENLHRAEFATWVDRARLHPGDGWDAEIHAALNTCAGAVVLLDPVVLTESDWVLTEATVLAHRYQTSADFRLIPVLLSGARPADLQVGHWAPLRLNEIQPVRENRSQVLEDRAYQAEDVARQVAAAFAGLAPLTTNPLLAWWLNETTELLKTLARHRLDGAARALRMDHGDWEAKGRRVELLAYALLDGDRSTIPKAVSQLAPLSNERPDPIGEPLSAKVSPLWVRLEMASGITRGLRSELTARRMLIATRMPDFAEDIIQRAVYCSHDLQVARCTGESGESLDRLVEICGRAIAKKLRRFDLWGDESPDDIAAKLAGADPPPFALISAEGLDEVDLASLIDQLGRRFPGVVLVLHSAQAGIARSLPPPGVPVVEPPLTEDEVRSAMIYRCRILELAGRECPYD